MEREKKVHNLMHITEESLPVFENELKISFKNKM